jgi:hypothetical protein
MRPPEFDAPTERTFASETMHKVVAINATKMKMKSSVIAPAIENVRGLKSLAATNWYHQK